MANTNWTGAAFLAGAVEAGKKQGYVKPKKKPERLRCDECHCFLSLKDAYEEGDWDDIDRDTYVFKLWLMTDCKNCGHRQGIEEVKA